MNERPKVLSENQNVKFVIKNNLNDFFFYLSFRISTTLFSLTSGCDYMLNVYLQLNINFIVLCAGVSLDKFLSQSLPYHSVLCPFNLALRGFYGSS